MPAQESSSVVRIGEWTVHPALDSISRGSETQKLEPRAMRLLMCLANSTGEVVSIDRLLTEVWAGVVVGSASVYEAVSQLRKILGDGDPKPTYIATVPRKGYRLIASVQHAAASDARSLDQSTYSASSGKVQRGVLRTRTSIAILPFANLTGDSSKEYLGDGITQELINTLSRAPNWFKVAAGTSVFAYKGKHIDVRQIAHDLEVDEVLEGSLLGVDERLRITVQLVDGRTGHHLWSRSYELKLTDWIDRQGELIVSIADALTIGAYGWSANDQKPPTRDLQAFQFFLQSKSLNAHPTEHNLRFSLELLARATERDPTFARAWGGMAVTRYNFVAMDYPLPNALTDAELAVHRALALDASLAGSRAILGFINACRGNWITAEAEFRASRLQLPRDPEVHLVHSIFVAQSAGHLRQAAEEAVSACALAPLTPAYAFYVGIAKWGAGQTSEALQWVRQAIADGMPETVGPVSDCLAHLAQREQRYQEAVGHMMNALSPAWRAAGAVEATTLFYSVLAQRSGRDRAAAALRKLEEGLRTEDFGQINSKRLIMWYTTLGSLDFAYEAADRALERFALSRTVGAAWGILWLEEMRSFRRDARFQAFVERLGLLDYWNQYGPPDNCELRNGRLLCP
jgi:TolB-like protein